MKRLGFSLILQYTDIQSLYRHVVCIVPVSCKANRDRNQLEAWLDSDLYLINASMIMGVNYCEEWASTREILTLVHVDKMSSLACALPHCDQYL